MVNPGILWTNYLSCEIETQEKGWKVVRKESDFQDLRRILSRLYPGCIIPKLPKNVLTKFDPALQNKRHRDLQRFLDELMFHPLLCSASFLKDFLRAYPKEYDDKKLLCENMCSPGSPNECYTINGNTNVYYDKNLSKFCSKISDSAQLFKEKFNMYF